MLRGGRGGGGSGMLGCGPRGAGLRRRRPGRRCILSS